MTLIDWVICYVLIQNPSIRESDFRQLWFPRNQRILDCLLHQRSSVICLQVIAKHLWIFWTFVCELKKLTIVTVHRKFGLGMRNWWTCTTSGLALQATPSSSCLEQTVVVMVNFLDFLINVLWLKMASKSLETSWNFSSLFLDLLQLTFWGPNLYSLENSRLEESEMVSSISFGFRRLLVGLYMVFNIVVCRMSFLMDGVEIFKFSSIGLDSSIWSPAIKDLLFIAVSFVDLNISVLQVF